MNILVINGSPNQNGNTDFAVDTYLTPFKDSNKIKYYHLAKLSYSGCIACQSCYNTGECIFKDDITSLYSDYNSADLVIIASPIYFLSVTSQLKAVIDRTQAIWASKYILKDPIIDRDKKRIGVFIGVAGANLENNVNLAAKTVMGMYFKAINTKFNDEIIIYNTDKIKIADNDYEHMNLLKKAEQMHKVVSNIF